MCGSGMKAIMMGYDSILSGSNNIVISGGIESMSNAPYILPKVREGLRMGHDQIKDHMFLDGLEDAYDEGKLKIIGDGENITDLTSVANLVDAIILALNTDNGINQTYNITNGAPVKLWDSINFLFNKLGKMAPNYTLSFLGDFVQLYFSSCNFFYYSRHKRK